MSDDPEQLSFKDLAKSGLGVTALVCVLAPFFIHITNSSSRTVNGEVVAQTSLDYPAIAGGALGLLLAVALLLARRAPLSVRGPFGGVVALLAVFHLANGLGVFNRAPPAAAVPEENLLAKKLKTQKKVECDAQHLEVCEERCAAGHAQDCNDFGSLLAEGTDGVAKDAAKAVTLFDKACQLDTAMGCTNLAFMLRKRLTPPEPERAFKALEKACGLGTADACNTMGFMFDHGEGMAEDNAKALSYFDKACEKGSGMGCKNAAFMYADGTGTERNAATAAARFDKGCELEDWSACNELGVLLDNGPERARATELFARSCQGGYPQGCSNLGVRRRTPAEGVEPDLAAALEAFTKGCDGKYGRACFELGLLYDEGLGTTKDAAKAVELYDQACGLANASGCVNAGVSYRDGDGVEVDETMAAVRFKDGCTQKSQKSCLLQALLTARTDVKKAKAELTDLCAEGFEDACVELKTLGKPPSRRKK